MRFTLLLRKTIRKHRSKSILIYDFHPLLSFRLIRWSIQKPAVLWYHNHDVADEKHLRKYSLMWWAWKSEKWIFPRLTLFTLPALERKDRFPMDTLKGSFFFIPNYPSMKVYGPYPVAKNIDTRIKLLYQGSIAPLHGLEEIIVLLDTKPGGRQLELVLKGFIGPGYLEELRALARQHKVEDKLTYIGPGGYSDVVKNARECHIGIGIHKKDDIMNNTLGTASNKIYEYAACGMPVILYDNKHFRQHLGKFSWTFFTDCSVTSLLDCIDTIAGNYLFYSEAARKDFVDSLNFEKFFLPLAGTGLHI